MSFFMNLPAYQAVLLIIAIYIIVKLIIAGADSAAARRRSRDMRGGDSH